MGFEDLVNKGREALGSEQAEQMSDTVVQHVGDAVDGLTGGRFAEQVDGVQQRADDMIGQPADAAAQVQQDQAQQ